MFEVRNFTQIRARKVFSYILCNDVSTPVRRRDYEAWLSPAPYHRNCLSFRWLSDMPVLRWKLASMLSLLAFDFYLETFVGILVGF